MLIGAVLFVLAAIIFNFLKGKEIKKTLILIAGEFGNHVSATSDYFGPDTVQFERDGTVFNGKIIIGGKSSDFNVSFDLPYIREKFFIRHKSFMADIRAD